MVAAFSGAFLMVVGFVVLIDVFRLVDKSRHVFDLSREALRIVSDPGLDDEVKEAAMQKHARTLAWLSLLIAAGVSVALAVPAALVFAFDVTGFLSFQEVLQALFSWTLLAVGTLLVIGVIMFRIRKRREL